MQEIDQLQVLFKLVPDLGMGAHELLQSRTLPGMGLVEIHLADLHDSNLDSQICTVFSGTGLGTRITPPMHRAGHRSLVGASVWVGSRSFSAKETR